MLLCAVIIIIIITAFQKYKAADFNFKQYFKCHQTIAKHDCLFDQKRITRFGGFLVP